MSRIGRIRSRSRRASSSTQEGRACASRDRWARSSARSIRRCSIERERRRDSRRAADRRAASSGAARPDPHAGQQHGHRRDRPASPRGSRSAASATARSCRASKLVLALGYSHPVEVDAAGRHRVPRRDAHPRWPSSAPTRSWSARSPPTSARGASRSRTRARASATPASRSCARPARPARSGAPSMIKTKIRDALRRKRHERAPAAARGHRRAPAPVGLPSARSSSMPR